MFVFIKLHKGEAGWVLVFVKNAQIKSAGPGNKYPQNKFFKNPISKTLKISLTQNLTFAASYDIMYT